MLFGLNYKVIKSNIQRYSVITTLEEPDQESSTDEEFLIGANRKIIALVTSLRDSESGEIFSSLTKLFDSVQEFIQTLQENNVLEMMGRMINSGNEYQESKDYVNIDDIEQYL